MRDSVSLHNFRNNFVLDKAVKKDYPFLVLPHVLQKSMFSVKENSVSEHLSKLTVYIVFVFSFFFFNTNFDVIFHFQNSLIFQWIIFISYWSRNHFYYLIGAFITSECSWVKLITQCEFRFLDGACFLYIWLTQSVFTSFSEKIQTDFFTVQQNVINTAIIFKREIKSMVTAWNDSRSVLWLLYVVGSCICAL